MSYALIDNATLTAVQRISGQVLTKSKDSVDTDIVALENMLQAIFFYDEIIAIDDYIPQFSVERKKQFSEIRFLDKEKFKLSEIEIEASKIADNIRPEIRAGEFANPEFKELISLLKTHIICTWDISSSVYHLTLKNLSDNNEDLKKYGNIAAGIFTELNEASKSGNHPSSDVKLIDRLGKLISKGYKVPGAKWSGGNGSSEGEASGAIKAFVASLIWLANRSIFYSLSSKYLKADAFLYPIRQSYQQHYISQTCNLGHNFSKPKTPPSAGVASRP